MTVEKDLVFGNSAPKNADILNYGSMKTIGGGTVNSTALLSFVEMLSFLPAIVLLLVLFFSIRLDNYLDKDRKRALYIISINMPPEDS